MIGMPSTSLQHQVRHAVLKTVEGLTPLLLADTSQPLSVQSSAERAALVRLQKVMYAMEPAVGTPETVASAAPRAEVDDGIGELEV